MGGVGWGGEGDRWAYRGAGVLGLPDRLCCQGARLPLTQRLHVDSPKPPPTSLPPKTGGVLPDGRGGGRPRRAPAVHGGPGRRHVRARRWRPPRARRAQRGPARGAAARARFPPPLGGRVPGRRLCPGQRGEPGAGPAGRGDGLAPAAGGAGGRPGAAGGEAGGVRRRRRPAAARRRARRPALRRDRRVERAVRARHGGAAARQRG